MASKRPFDSISDQAEPSARHKARQFSAATSSEPDLPGSSQTPTAGEDVNMPQSSSAPGSPGAGTMLIDSQDSAKERLHAAFQATTSTLLQVAEDLGNPDGFWAARGTPLFDECSADIRQLSGAVALVLERHLNLFSDWSILPGAARAAGQEVSQLKARIASLNTAKDATSQQLSDSQAEVARLRERLDYVLRVSPPPPSSREKGKDRSVRADSPLPISIPSTPSRSPSLRSMNMRSPSPAPARSPSPAPSNGQQRSYASVAAPSPALRRSPSPAVSSVASPRYSSPCGSRPPVDPRAKLQTMTQLVQFYPDADTTTLDDMATTFHQVNGTPAQVPTGRAERHRAALPRARAVHRPTNAARELYVTFVGGSGAPKADLRNTEEEILTQCNEALIHSAHASTNRVEYVQWRRSDGSCIIRMQAVPSLEDVNVIRSVAEGLTADEEASVHVSPFRRCTYLLIRSCPVENAALGERPSSAIYDEIERLNPQWRGMLVPPTVSPLPFWYGRKDHATTAGLVVAVYDTQRGSNSFKLCAHPIRIGRTLCRVELFQQRERVPMCRNCLKWGHTRATCHSLRSVCARCGGHHLQSEHDEHAACCLLDPEGKKDGHCTHPPMCVNCTGPHTAFSRECPFFRHRFEPEWWRQHGASRVNIRLKGRALTAPPSTPGSSSSVTASPRSPATAGNVANTTSGNNSSNRYVALTDDRSEEDMVDDSD